MATNAIQKEVPSSHQGYDVILFSNPSRELHKSITQGVRAVLSFDVFSQVRKPKMLKTWVILLLCGLLPCSQGLLGTVQSVARLDKDVLENSKFWVSFVFFFITILTNEAGPFMPIPRGKVCCSHVMLHCLLGSLFFVNEEGKVLTESMLCTSTLAGQRLKV